jgi:uncharacterized membrane protein YfcA
MEPFTLLLLFCAGVAGGIVNALAGGATLITFPAMLAAGLPPLVANASNAVAVTPGHLVAAIADRGKLPPPGWRLAGWLSAALVGGAGGAWLLFSTPEQLFTMMVPALIGLATLAFAFGKRLKAVLPEMPGNRARTAVLALTSVYGGYFGAGLGVMLLAVLTLSGSEDGRTANALKNLLATAASAASVMVLAATGLVSWPATLVGLIGAISGGVIGGGLLAVLPEHVVRAAVVLTGALMTIIYAGRYWL